jgi:hypothetical protein
MGRLVLFRGIHEWIYKPNPDLERRNPRIRKRNPANQKEYDKNTFYS